MVTSSAGKLGKEIPILLSAIIFALTCPVKKVIIVFLPEFVLAVLVQQAQCDIQSNIYNISFYYTDKDI
jgi:hypothetical protein